MCCGNKCLFFIPVRTGSLIFGYIIAVISALGTIGCTGVYLFCSIMLMFPNYRYNGRLEVIAGIILTTGYLVEFLSSFVSSVLLLVGITQNKPAFVKAFLIYGMIQVLLLLVFFIMLHCATSFFYAGFLLLALALVGVYALFLYMVFKAYQPMVNGNVFSNPIGNAVHQLMNPGIRNDRQGEVLAPSGI